MVRALDGDPCRVRGVARTSLAWILGAVLLSGCAGLGPVETAAVTSGVIGLTTVLGGRAPNNEIEQTYYLGVFDPQDQLPPTVYRVRVHGQASAMSQVNFASGWVPADILDALGSRVSIDRGTHRVKIEKAEDQAGTFKPGRRLMMFGPEGFREAPANHRLVIVMGTSPEAFFRAIDESLGVLAMATQEQGSHELQGLLAEAHKTVYRERVRLDSFRRDIDADVPAVAR